MAIVAGFDVHRAQITFDALDTDTGELAGAGSSRHPMPSAPGSGASPASGSRSRLKPVPVGCSSVNRSPRLGRPRIWRRRPRSAPGGARSGTRRPTAPTHATCASCSARAACPRPGCRPHTSSSGGRGHACARRSSTNARSGCSGSGRHSSTTACRRPRSPSGCSAREAAPSSSASSCRRLRASE